MEELQTSLVSAGHARYTQVPKERLASTEHQVQLGSSSYQMAQAHLSLGLLSLHQFVTQQALPT